jgi:hypothetical protein
MVSAKDYQRYAKECLQWAAKANTEKDRQTFLEMADAWTRVAWIRSDATRQSAFDGSGAIPLTRS